MTACRLELRREMAEKSAAQARDFEGLPPIFDENGQIIRSLTRVRYPQDEQLVSKSFIGCEANIDMIQIW
jgi:hypothetical protein